MINTTRRTILKGIAIGTGATATAVSLPTLAGLPLEAELASGHLSATETSLLPTCDLTVERGATHAHEAIEIHNTTASNVRIDSISSESLPRDSGALQIALQVDGADGQEPRILKPGESMQIMLSAHTSQAVFDGQATSLLPNVIAGQITVNSPNPAFNGVIPVTVFDLQVAMAA